MNYIGGPNTLFRINITPILSDMYVLEDEIIENEDYDFILFLCILLSMKRYIYFNGYVYIPKGGGHTYFKLLKLRIKGLYMYDASELSNMVDYPFKLFIYNRKDIECIRVVNQ
jgi:hypothetical protein